MPAPVRRARRSRASDRREHGDARRTRKHRREVPGGMMPARPYRRRCQRRCRWRRPSPRQHAFGEQLAENAAAAATKRGTHGDPASVPAHARSAGSRRSHTPSATRDDDPGGTMEVVRSSGPMSASRRVRMVTPQPVRVRGDLGDPLPATSAMSARDCSRPTPGFSRPTPACRRCALFGLWRGGNSVQVGRREYLETRRHDPMTVKSWLSSVIVRPPAPVAAKVRGTEPFADPRCRGFGVTSWRETGRRRPTPKTSKRRRDGLAWNPLGAARAGQRPAAARDRGDGREPLILSAPIES